MDSRAPHTGYKGNPLAVMQPGEQVICEIKRHPIGLMSTYAVTGIGLLALIVLGDVAIKQFVPLDVRSHVLLLFLLMVLVVAVLAIMLLFVTTTIYWNNRWVVTSDSVTQIQQKGLFQHQTSQLSMANLEDITAEQNGMLQSMLNYGSLKVETAGERSKFTFMFCPNPTYYARQILAAREAFIRTDPAAAARANDKLVTPPQPTIPT